ncbi:hypothetical protein A9974_12065 [Achromobacter sp. UMC71]|nr:hypothetical protein [Achromobacter sp. UMC71]
MQPDTAWVHDQAPLIESHRSLQVRVPTENQSRVGIASAAFDLIKRRWPTPMFRYGLEEIEQIALWRAMHKQDVFGES